MTTTDPRGAADESLTVPTSWVRTPGEFDALRKAITRFETAAARRRQAPARATPGRRHWALWLVLLLVTAEVGVFYWENRDVVKMSRPTNALVVDAGFPAAARSVLARERVSRRVLEVVVDVARQRDDLDLHVDALRRIVSVAPEDPGARLRLAQALRESGRLDEAERIYRDEIGDWPQEVRRQ